MPSCQRRTATPKPDQKRILWTIVAVDWVGLDVWSFEEVHKIEIRGE